MGYRLKDGLSFCVTGRHVIFLDVEADRYFGLRPGCEEAFHRLLAGNEPGPALAGLVKSGLVREDSETTKGLEPVSVPRAVREVPKRPRSPLCRQSLACVIAQIRAMALLKTRRFGLIVREIENRSQQAAFGNTKRAEQDWGPIVSAFAASANLRPRSGHCLISSIAFVHVAHCAGLQAKLVLGVSAAPFSAHCWVQADDYVLNDRLENIRPFEPILAV